MRARVFGSSDLRGFESRDERDFATGDWIIAMTRSGFPWFAALAKPPEHGALAAVIDTANCLRRGSTAEGRTTGGTPKEKLTA